MIGDVAPYSSENSELSPSLLLEKPSTPVRSPPTTIPEKDQEQDQFIPVFEQPEEEKIKDKVSMQELRR